MHDLDDESVITAFLLGALDEEEKARVFDRLGDDEGYFERVEAAEDDLILRWHRGTLTPEQRELFARAYAAPARRARVDASLALLRAAEESVAGERADTSAVVGPFDRLRAWLTAPWLLPRWAVAAGAVAIVAAMLTGAYLGNRRIPGDGGDSRASGPPVIVAVTLTAIGEKGPPVAKGFDTIHLPRAASAVQLTVEPRVTPDGAALAADISSPDHGTVLRLGAPAVGRSPTGTTLTVTVPTRDLPDGDYVLTVRRAGAGGSDILSTQAFRVIRASD